MSSRKLGRYERMLTIVGFASVWACCERPCPADSAQYFITGSVESNGSPVAAAKVALYWQTDGLLLAETLTREDGGFTLVGPDSSADLFLVVTGKGQSSRHKFQWRGKGSQNLDINVSPTTLSLWTQAGSWIWNRFEEGVDILLGVAIGFLFGLLARRYQDRQLLKVHLSRLIPHRSEVLRSKAEIDKLQAADSSTSRADGKEIARIRDAYYAVLEVLGGAAKRLRDALPDEVVVFPVKGEKGIDARQSLAEAIAEIESFSHARVFPPTDLQPLVRAIEELIWNPLITR